jgi:hypothetical protein
MKLKTLKDLEDDFWMYAEMDEKMFWETSTISLKEAEERAKWFSKIMPTLKAEAVKWIKDLKLQQHTYRHNKKAKCQCPKCRQRRYCWRWIEGFFNITEEDLK